MLVPYHCRSRQRGGYPVFQGHAYQRGRGFGSVLSSMFRNFVVPAAKDLGKNLLRTGLKKASGVMNSVADGRSLGEAVTQEFNVSQRAPRAQPQRVQSAWRSSAQPVQRATANRKRKAQPQRARAAKRMKRDIFN